MFCSFAWIYQPGPQYGIPTPSYHLAEMFTLSTIMDKSTAGREDLGLEDLRRAINVFIREGWRRVLRLGLTAPRTRRLYLEQDEPGRLRPRLLLQGLPLRVSRAGHLPPSTIGDQHLGLRRGDRTHLGVHVLPYEADKDR